MPLVAGVESMQILYGDDNDADGIVNRYIRGGIGNVSAPNNVRSVKLSIIARTPGTSAVDRSTRDFDHFGIDYFNAVPQANDKSRFPAPGDGRTYAAAMRELEGNADVVFATPTDASSCRT